MGSINFSSLRIYSPHRKLILGGFSWTLDRIDHSLQSFFEVLREVLYCIFCTSRHAFDSIDYGETIEESTRFRRDISIAMPSTSQIRTVFSILALVRECRMIRFLKRIRPMT